MEEQSSGVGRSGGEEPLIGGNDLVGRSSKVPGEMSRLVKNPYWRSLALSRSNRGKEKKRDPEVRF